MNPKNRAKNSVQVRVTVAILVAGLATLLGRDLQERALLLLMMLCIINFIWNGNYAEKKSKVKQSEIPPEGEE